MSADRIAPTARERTRLVAGLAIHALVLVGLVSLGLAAVQPAIEVGSRVASAFDAERDGDLIAVVPTTEGLVAGLPAFIVDVHGGGRPVAHVVSWDDTGRRVRLRFAPGEGGNYAVRVFPPRRGFGDAFALAVPQETAQEITATLRARIRILWEEVLREDVKARMPALFERLDPRNENETRTMLDGLGQEAMTRMQPHVDDLVKRVTRAVDKQLGVWDRLGVLWDMVRGDEKKLQKRLAPVAEKAAREWWESNRDDVTTSLGEALDAQLPEIRQWLETDVLIAAREELVEPLYESHKDRLEGEVEAIVRMVLDRVVRLPNDGGFQIRFAAMLRHVLLGKQTALLLLEPVDPAG